MRLGLSSYRMFQGTNAAPCALELVNYGIGSHSDPGACMGNALGIGMAVLCTDGRLLFIRRSQHVGEARGLVDLIGGHSEPSAAGLAPAMLLDDDEVPVGWAPSPRLRPLHAPAAAEACPPASANAAARRELFASALDEVVEEMNLRRDALGPPLLLGTSCNFTTGGRVALAFVVPFAGSADDAVRRYREVPAEAFESTAMLHLPAQEVLDAVQRAGGREADDTAGWATTADGAGRASEVAEAIVGAAEPGTWRPVFELALHGAVETPSACPAGDSGEVADAAPAPGPKSLQPSQIAPACMAALVLFALAAEAHGGVDGLQAAIRATSSA
ncbi:hypothetical protein FNF27_00786 [Cafeteria roenbergensis]|nr:hypothetical protein FNF27_00786 [Cafeteria roenbergensis]